MNGEPSPEHRCRSLTDAVLVQTRMLSAQVHYHFSYSQTQPQKDYFILFTLLAPRDWSLLFNRQKCLEPSKQRDNDWGENRGWGRPTGICSKRMQVSLAPRGWVCIRAAAAPWAWGGEGAAQDGGWGALQCHYKLPGWERASVVPKGRHCLPRGLCLEGGKRRR